MASLGTATSFFVYMTGHLCLFSRFNFYQKTLFYSCFYLLLAHRSSSSRIRYSPFRSTMAFQAPSPAAATASKVQRTFPFLSLPTEFRCAVYEQYLDCGLNRRVYFDGSFQRGKVVLDEPRAKEKGTRKQLCQPRVPSPSTSSALRKVYTPLLTSCSLINTEAKHHLRDNTEFTCRHAIKGVLRRKANAQRRSTYYELQFDCSRWDSIQTKHIATKLEEMKKFTYFLRISIYTSIKNEDLRALLQRSTSLFSQKPGKKTLTLRLFCHNEMEGEKRAQLDDIVVEELSNISRLVGKKVAFEMPMSWMSTDTEEEIVIRKINSKYQVNSNDATSGLTIHRGFGGYGFEEPLPGARHTLDPHR